MEEPPKIARVMASRGVSLPAAAALLTTYVANLDQHHQLPEAPPSVDGDRNDLETPREEQITPKNAPDDKAGTTPWKSRQEREEEALLAQMDQLANNSQSLLAGRISDEVSERLTRIADSLRAEAEGTLRSVCGSTAGAENKSAAAGDDEPEVADEMFAEAESEASERLEPTQSAQQPREDNQQRLHTDRAERDRKREKKAKKKAKKQAKKAKRKAQDTAQGAGGQSRKRTKMTIPE